MQGLDLSFDCQGIHIKEVPTSKMAIFDGTQSQLWTKQQNRLPTQVVQISSGQLTIATLHAKSLQSGPALCEPMGCCPPGSSAHGILQARMLESVAMPSSRGCSRPKYQTHICISGTAGGYFTTEPPGKPGSFTDNILLRNLE